MKYLSLFYLCLLLSSCILDDKKSDFTESGKLKEITFFKKWEFHINNNDNKSFGYKKYLNDQDIGVKGICVFNDFVFLTDVYHVNIKKINIKTGKVECSEPLTLSPSDESGVWLNDIAVFDNKIYVSSDNDSIYVFTLDLKYLKTISYLKEGYYFIKVSEDSLLLDNSFLLTNELDSFKLVTEENEYKRINNIQGKRYEVYEKDKVQIVKTQFGAIQLNIPIPEIIEYSGAENINFNSDTFVYFDSNSKEFVLYVYKF